MQVSENCFLQAEDNLYILIRSSQKKVQARDKWGMSWGPVCILSECSWIGLGTSVQETVSSVNLIQNEIFFTSLKRASALLRTRISTSPQFLTIRLSWNLDQPALPTLFGVFCSACKRNLMFRPKGIYRLPKLQRFLHH